MSYVGYDAIGAKKEERKNHMDEELTALILQFWKQTRLQSVKDVLVGAYFPRVLNLMQYRSLHDWTQWCSDDQDHDKHPDHLLQVIALCKMISMQGLRLTNGHTLILFGELFRIYQKISNKVFQISSCFEDVHKTRRYK